MHARSLTALLVLAASGSPAVAQSIATMPPHASDFSSWTRGYYFTAPEDMRIVGVKVLQAPTVSRPYHNWAIVRFHDNTPPPIYFQTTNAFDQLALGLDQPSDVFAPTSVEVLAGEVIGIYGNTAWDVGTSSGFNSYTTNSPPTTMLFGTTVDLFRSGMQFHLGSATSPQGMHDIWHENFFAISRVEFQYESLAGNPYCFGDGSGAFCPCANFGGTGEGCANSGQAGGVLGIGGSSSVGAADLVLRGTQLVPSAPGLYFQGDMAMNGGLGVAFGDGLRCAGINVARLEVLVADSAGTSSTTVDIVAAGGVSAGATLYYQIWYRDPVASPCGTPFNLTNGQEIAWVP